MEFFSLLAFNFLTKSPLHPWNKGTLNDFWFDYVQFNLIYSSAEGGEVTKIDRWNSFYHFYNTSFFSIAFVFSIFLVIKTKSKRSFWFVYTIPLILSLTLICIAGKQFEHYGMVLVPIVIILIGGILSFLSEHRSNNQPIGTYLLAGFLLCTIIWKDLAAVINSSGTRYIKNRNNNHIAGDVKNMAEMIQSNTFPDETISVYGNRDIIYVISERAHATKYSYQFPIGNVYPIILEEYWKELHEEQPKIIVVSKGYYDDTLKSFLENGPYDMLWTDNKDSINNGYSMFIRTSGN